MKFKIVFGWILFVIPLQLIRIEHEI